MVLSCVLWSRFKLNEYHKEVGKTAIHNRTLQSGGNSFLNKKREQKQMSLIGTEKKTQVYHHYDHGSSNSWVLLPFKFVKHYLIIYSS